MTLTDLVNVIVIAALGGGMTLVVCRTLNARRCKVPPDCDGDLTAFELGDPVSKCGGDYRFDGFVMARFVKRSGARRYVVEDDRGVLHIYADKNLRAR